MTAGLVAKQPTAQVFTRDKLTWLGYLLYGWWSFVWALFGPLMPFLRSELHLNYSVAALHFSALALGPFMAGFIGYRVISALGPARTVVTGSAFVIAGVVAVLTGVHHYTSIFGAWLIGFGGSHAGQAIVANLADRFQAHRTKAIAEINIIGALFTASAPLAVAAGINLGLPWKSTFILSFSLLAAACLLTQCGGGKTFQISGLGTQVQNQRLPRSYWIYFAIVFLSVAGEWSVCFWSPEFLEKVLHYSRANACAGLSTFSLSMLAGRLIGARLSGAFSTTRLLALTSLVAVSGFLLFWFGKNPVATFAGLALLGLGEANVYPLALSASIGASEGRTAKATSTMSLSTGSAILLAPLLLGVVADKVGLPVAYGLIAALFTVAMTAAFWADLRSSRP